MRKNALIYLLLLSFTAMSIAQESAPYVPLYVNSLEEARAPHIVGHDLIFSYNSVHSRPNVVAISFGHEGYRELHYLQRNGHGVFFLTLPIEMLPYRLQEVHYFYIVDGIWVADANSEGFGYDSVGQRYSLFSLPPQARIARSPEIEGREISFVFHPQHRDIVRISELSGTTYALARDIPYAIFVAGSFNGWDPFATPLQRVEEGDTHHYRAEVTLPRGEYRYYFVVNGARILDPLNNDTVIDRYGKRASFFMIE